MRDESILSMPIGNMDVSVRLRNCLKAADCETVGDVVKYDKIHFLKMRNFGKRSLSELESFLADHHLSFGTSTFSLQDDLSLLGAANDYCLNVRKGYPRIMDDTDRLIRNAFEDGAKWQKEHLLKDATLGEIHERSDGTLGWTTAMGTTRDYRNYLLSHFKNGDRVKLIIIKDE